MRKGAFFSAMALHASEQKSMSSLDRSFCQQIKHVLHVAEFALANSSFLALSRHVVPQ